MFNPHFVHLNKGILKRHQPNIAGITVVIVAGTLDRAIIHKVGRLTTQSTQSCLKVSDTGLQRGQYRCGGNPLGFVKMGDMQLSIGQYIKNH